MIQAAALGGLFIGVLSALPIVNVANCCCLWILGGGALSSYLLQQNEPRPPGIGRGAAVGVLAGIAGAFAWLFLSLVLDSVMAPIQERMVGAMVRNAQDMPPDVRAFFDAFTNRAASPFRFVVGFTFQLLAGVVFAPVGGVLGALYLRPDAASAQS